MIVPFRLDLKQQVRFEKFKSIRSEPLTEKDAFKLIQEEGGSGVFEQLRQGLNLVLVGPRHIHDYNGCACCIYYNETDQMVCLTL
jgi:hypothetical protein